MLNVMEERDIQIRGYVLRLPLDMLVVASANPEDYTNRGRIITPLKDRFGAEIRTHYPVELDDEIAVIRQEAHLVAERARPPRGDPRPLHPRPARVQLGRPALRVSRARFAIAGAETIAAAALHRATAQGEDEPVARVGRPRDRGRRARRQDRVRDRRGGTRGADPRAPAAHGPPPRRCAPGWPGLDLGLLVAAIEDGASVTTGEQVTARDFLGGLPVLGESELYDEVCDRLDATNDGERAGPSSSLSRGSSSPRR